jgi:hypothetical protein
MNDDPFGAVSRAGKKAALKVAKGHSASGAKKTVRTKSARSSRS